MTQSAEKSARAKAERFVTEERVSPAGGSRPQLGSFDPQWRKERNIKHGTFRHRIKGFPNWWVVTPQWGSSRGTTPGTSRERKRILQCSTVKKKRKEIFGGSKKAVHFFCLISKFEGPTRQSARHFSFKCQRSKRKAAIFNFDAVNGPFL